MNLRILSNTKLVSLLVVSLTSIPNILASNSNNIVNNSFNCNGLSINRSAITKKISNTNNGYIFTQFGHNLSINPSGDSVKDKLLKTRGSLYADLAYRKLINRTCYIDAGIGVNGGTLAKGNNEFNGKINIFGGIKHESGVEATVQLSAPFIGNINKGGILNIKYDNKNDYMYKWAKFSIEGGYSDLYNKGGEGASPFIALRYDTRGIISYLGKIGKQINNYINIQILILPKEIFKTNIWPEVTLGKIKKESSIREGYYGVDEIYKNNTLEYGWTNEGLTTDSSVPDTQGTSAEQAASDLGPNALDTQGTSAEQAASDLGPNALDTQGTSAEQAASDLGPNALDTQGTSAEQAASDLGPNALDTQGTSAEQAASDLGPNALDTQGTSAEQAASDLGPNALDTQGTSAEQAASDLGPNALDTQGTSAEQAASDLGPNALDTQGTSAEQAVSDLGPNALDTQGTSAEQAASDLGPNALDTQGTSAEQAVSDLGPNALDTQGTSAEQAADTSSSPNSLYSSYFESAGSSYSSSLINPVSPQFVDSRCFDSGAQMKQSAQINSDSTKTTSTDLKLPDTGKEIKISEQNSEEYVMFRSQSENYLAGDIENEPNSFNYGGYRVGKSRINICDKLGKDDSCVNFRKTRSGIARTNLSLTGTNRNVYPVAKAKVQNVPSRIPSSLKKHSQIPRRGGFLIKNRSGAD